MAHNFCEVILGGDLFEDCHGYVDHVEFMEKCEEAACSCSPGGNTNYIATCAEFCDVISEYGNECALHMNDDCPLWRSERLCPMMCESRDHEKYDCVWHYECCANCYPTCEDPHPSCEEPCHEGCAPHCEEDGHLYSTELEKCVKAEECGEMPFPATTESMTTGTTTERGDHTESMGTFG